jgi:hypothetical protein
MSLWGKRVGSWFDGGRTASSRADYNNAARNALVWIAIIAIVLAGVFLLDRADDGNLDTLGRPFAAYG